MRSLFLLFCIFLLIVHCLAQWDMGGGMIGGMWDKPQNEGQNDEDGAKSLGVSDEIK